jgi:hypothetical protein
MAAAHGAGFMVLPFLMTLPTDVLASGHPHAGHVIASSTAPLRGAIALLTHSAAYLITTALVAQVVYRKVGLRLLRTAWFNLDWLWTGTLIGTGIVVLFT